MLRDRPQMQHLNFTTRSILLQVMTRFISGLQVVAMKLLILHLGICKSTPQFSLAHVQILDTPRRSPGLRKVKNIISMNLIFTTIQLLSYMSKVHQHLPKLHQKLQLPQKLH